MKRVLLCYAVYISVLAPVLVSSAGAEVFNVSTVMDLQIALNTAAANGEDDTINVAEGTYNVTSTLTFSGAYSLTIQGAGTGSTVLDGGGLFQIMSLSVFSGPIVVRGITFRNGNPTTGIGGGLVVGASASAATIENCEFLNNATNLQSGGGLGVSGNQVTVNNNTFTSNGDNDTYGGGGAELSGETVTVTGNTFTGNTGGVAGGMEIMSTGLTTSVTVADNVFSGNTGFFHGGGISIEGSGTYELVNNVFFNNICHSGGVRDGDGIFASGVDTLTLTNNTFLNNGEEPVTIRLFGTSTASVYNNIVWDTSFLQRPIIIFDAILFDGQAPFAKVFNNDLRGFDATDVSLPDNPENFTSGGNIIDSDPLFLDPSEGDVHLQPGSPAINAGTKNAPSLPARDFEGNSRIIDHTVDIGADEFIPPSKAMPWIPLLLLDD